MGSFSYNPLKSLFFFHCHLDHFISSCHKFIFTLFLFFFWAKVMIFINGAQQRMQRLLLMHQHKAGFSAVLQNQVSIIEIHPLKHVSFKFRKLNMYKSRSSKFLETFSVVVSVDLCLFLEVNASTRTILVTFFWGLFWGLFPIWRLFWRLFFQKIIAKLKIVSKIVFKQKINLKITFRANSHQNSPGRCVHL